MTVLTWLATDLVTGQIVEELPELQPSGTIGALLGAYTSASFSLPIPLAGHGAPPRNWEGATEPGRSMIVAVLGGVPIWAGVVVTRSGGTDATVRLGCVTLEGYLDRRYVRNHTWAQQDEAAVIAAGLLFDANVEGIGLVVDAPATGTLRDRTYADQDDATVYSRLRELMGVIDGPEFTTALTWADVGQTTLIKTVRVRKRIGLATSTPNAVFSSGGSSSARYEYSEDYTASSGANHIVATSSGDGETRPQSAPARDEALIAAGWPRWEHRFNAGSNISEVGTLDGHALAALALMADGARTLTITARADVYPLLGTDWSVGEDVAYELIGHRHPGGLNGVARAVGWQLDPRAGTVSPILLAAGEDVIE